MTIFQTVSIAAIAFTLAGTAQADRVEASECAIQAYSPEIVKMIEPWLASNNTDKMRRYVKRADIQLAKSDNNCRDQEALERTKEILSVRLNQADVYDFRQNRETYDERHSFRATHAISADGSVSRSD